MERRGYNVTPSWWKEGFVSWKKMCPPYIEVEACAWKSPLYKEHGDTYYKECINLAQKELSWKEKYL